MTAPLIRSAMQADAAAIARIDAAGLATGRASFRAEPHGWESFAAVYGGPGGLGLVAESGGAVCAWAGVTKTSARAVYAGVGEVSIYVDPAMAGRGIGRALLGALVTASENAGFWTLIAQCFAVNERSIALHRACGFRALARRERLGRMSYGPLAGTWQDVVLLERRSGRVGLD